MAGRCLHFCFGLIIFMSLIPFVGEESDNFSINHRYDGDSFEPHYINQSIGDGFVLTKEHRYRLQCYDSESGFLADVFDIERFWKLQKFLHQNRWVEDWLRRELQALMQEENVDSVLHQLLGVIDSFYKRAEFKHKQEAAKTTEAKQEEFKSLISEAARPFIMARTVRDRLVDELELFLASGLNIEAYDSIYKQGLGWNNPQERSEMRDANQEREGEEDKSEEDSD